MEIKINDMELAVLIDGVHEYNYKKSLNGDNEIHTLYYSKSSLWDERLHDKEAIVIMDIGDGYKIDVKREVGVKYNGDFIDYGEAAALKYLLDIISNCPKAEHYKKIDL